MLLPNPFSTCRFHSWNLGGWIPGCGVEEIGHAERCPGGSRYCRVQGGEICPIVEPGSECSCSSRSRRSRVTRGRRRKWQPRNGERWVIGKIVNQSRETVGKCGWQDCSKQAEPAADHQVCTRSERTEVKTKAGLNLPGMIVRQSKILSRGDGLIVGDVDVVSDVEEVVVKATKTVRGATRIRIAISANRESQTQIAFNAPGVLPIEAQVIKVDRLFEPSGE